MKKIFIIPVLLIAILNNSWAQHLKRAVPEKEFLTSIPEYSNGNTIVIKIGQNETTDSRNYTLWQDRLLLKKIHQAVGNEGIFIKPLISQPKELLMDFKEKGERASGILLGNLSLYFSMDMTGLSVSEKLKIHHALSSLNELETVYFTVDPVFVSSSFSFIEQIIPNKSATPDLSSGQFYLDPAPKGVDAKYAWTKPGGDGAGIQFCDMELGMHKKHEDLISNPVNDIGVIPCTEDHHGTAVHGVVYAAHNGFGVNGMAPKIKPYFVTSRDSSGTGFAMADAMARVIPYFNKGDVLLLEMMDQSGDPNSNYAPVEFSQAEFDVIQNLTASGIIVVEAAGNGNKNLDDKTKYGQKFDSTYRYSGAFIIGGAASGVTGGTKPALKRLSPSSYGSRVDFFAYSEMVTSTGYGDLYGSVNEDKYTKKFFGTSSASPIITGACILLQSIYKNASGGQTLDHAQMKAILTMGATQSYDPTTDKIGVLPNLKVAVDYALTTTAINETNSGNAYFIYPAMTNDKLFVSGKNDNEISISVVDLSGKCVYETRSTSAYAHIIDVSGLMPGIYMVRICDASSVSILKFMKTQN